MNFILCKLGTIFLLLSSFILMSCSKNSEITDLSDKENLWGEYGAYHTIEFQLYSQQEKYRDVSLCEILTIDGKKTADKILINVEYFGGGVPNATKPFKASGFVTLEPVGSPVKNFPEESFEKTTLNDYYTRVPPIQPNDGRNYVVDMEPLVFHLKEIFVITSVISPDDARIKFENSREGSDAALKSSDILD